MFYFFGRGQGGCFRFYNHSPSLISIHSQSPLASGSHSGVPELCLFTSSCCFLPFLSVLLIAALRHSTHLHRPRSMPCTPRSLPPLFPSFSHHGCCVLYCKALIVYSGLFVHTANSELLQGEEFAFKCPGGLYI